MVVLLLLSVYGLLVEPDIYWWFQYRWKKHECSGAGDFCVLRLNQMQQNSVHDIISNGCKYKPSVTKEVF